MTEAAALWMGGDVSIVERAAGEPMTRRADQARGPGRTDAVPRQRRLPIHDRPDRRRRRRALLPRVGRHAETLVSTTRPACEVSVRMLPTWDAATAACEGQQPCALRQLRSHRSGHRGPAVLGGPPRAAPARALVWVESNGGFWAATSYEVVLRIAQDWETFSSAEGVSFRPPEPGRDALHHADRHRPAPPARVPQQVNPHLTPEAVVGYEPAIRQIADELIDSFIGRWLVRPRDRLRPEFPGTVFFRLIVHCERRRLPRRRAARPEP